MKLFTLLFAGAFLFALYSCSGGPSKDEMDDILEAEALLDEEEEVIDKTPIEVTWEQLESGELKDGQVVIVKGYVEALANQMTTYSNKSSSFYMLSRRNEDGYRLRVSLPIGKLKNQVARLPEEYYHTDLVITTNNNEKAGVASYVEVMGEYEEGMFPESGCNLELMEVKLLGEFDKSIFEEAVLLTDEMASDVKHNGTYVYTEGELSMKYVFKMGNLGMYSVSMDPSEGSIVDKVMFKEGYWGGTCAVDEGGSLFFLDPDGNAIVKGDKVRIYGTYEKSDYGDSGTFDVEEIVKL